MDDPMTYAAVIIQPSIFSLRARGRVFLIRSMADYLQMDPLLLTLSRYRDTADLGLNNIRLVASEISERNFTNQEATEIYWPVSCGRFEMLRELIQVLNHNVIAGRFSQYLGYHISGWRIFRKGGEKIMLNRRHRRQVIMVSPTPVMTPPKPTHFSRLASTVATQDLSEKFMSNTDFFPRLDYVTKSSSAQPNNSPTVLKPIDLISATVGQMFEYSIPADTFFDREDGHTRNLSLKIASTDGSPSGRESWLQLNQSLNVLFGYPLESDFQYSPQQLVLTAADSAGLVARETFVIEIQLSRDAPCHLYTLRTKNSYHSFLKDRGRIIHFLEKLAKYFNDSNSKYISLFDIKPGSTLVLWYNNSLCSATGVSDPCPINTIENLFAFMRLPDDTVRPSFVETMLPEYRIQRVKNITYRGVCLPIIIPTTHINIIQPNSTYWLPNTWPSLLIALILILLIALLVIIYYFCRNSEKILPSEVLNFQENQPIPQTHLELDRLRSRKPPMLIPEVSPSSQRWVKLPHPPPYPSHPTFNNTIDHNSRVTHLHFKPPKYQLPPLFELHSPRNTTKHSKNVYS
ncbi:dystroglycan-like [Callorhinchus milii]|uniref:dystroglycan-like n=1 Tax=Callorhinchus milii TaxID=7868 RepID=UPI001C3FB748|nr:dystroglycan-like [Callorhinchus milii]